MDLNAEPHCLRVVGAVRLQRRAYLAFGCAGNFGVASWEGDCVGDIALEEAVLLERSAYALHLLRALEQFISRLRVLVVVHAH